ncbi:1,4-beta-D-glucanase-like [Sesbania bispinosa]|nr:1,4-beta-D-glucanase-like [Sesbania bispinosa]
MKAELGSVQGKDWGQISLNKSYSRFSEGQWQKILISNNPSFQRKIKTLKRQTIAKHQSSRGSGENKNRVKKRQIKGTTFPGGQPVAAVPPSLPRAASPAKVPMSAAPSGSVPLRLRGRRARPVPPRHRRCMCVPLQPPPSAVTGVPVAMQGRHRPPRAAASLFLSPCFSLSPTAKSEYEMVRLREVGGEAAEQDEGGRSATKESLVLLFMTQGRHLLMIREPLNNTAVVYLEWATAIVYFDWEATVYLDWASTVYFDWEATVYFDCAATVYLDWAATAIVYFDWAATVYFDWAATVYLDWATTVAIMYLEWAATMYLDWAGTVANLESFVKLNPGVAHGWTMRYKVDDEGVVKSVEEAHQDMLNWFIKQVKELNNGRRHGGFRHKEADMSRPWWRQGWTNTELDATAFYSKMVAEESEQQLQKKVGRRYNVEGLI